MEIALRDDARSPDTELSELAQAALDASIPESTLRKYKGHWEQYLAWCASVGRTPLPATVETMIEYITHLTYGRGLSPSTVNQARWAIAKAHELAGAEMPPGKPVAKVIKGYRTHLAKTKNPKAKPKKATPITLSALPQFADAADSGKLIGVRDRAMILLHYSIGARISELVALNIEDLTEMPDGILVAVYRSKTDSNDEVAIPDVDAPHAVAAIRAWRTKLAELGRTSGPLFVRINQHGHVAPPLRRNGQLIGDPDGRITLGGAERVIKKLGHAAGLEGNWSGHSLRSGMATQAHRGGADRFAIAAQGGWHPDSPAMSGYIAAADKWTHNALKGAGY